MPFQAANAPVPLHVDEAGVYLYTSSGQPTGASRPETPTVVVVWPPPGAARRLNARPSTCSGPASEGDHGIPHPAHEAAPQGLQKRPRSPVRGMLLPGKKPDDIHRSARPSNPLEARRAEARQLRSGPSRAKQWRTRPNPGHSARALLHRAALLTFSAEEPKHDAERLRITCSTCRWAAVRVKHSRRSHSVSSAGVGAGQRTALTQNTTGVRRAAAQEKARHLDPERGTRLGPGLRSVFSAYNARWCGVEPAALEQLAWNQPRRHTLDHHHRRSRLVLQNLSGSGRVVVLVTGSPHRGGQQVQPIHLAVECIAAGARTARGGPGSATLSVARRSMSPAVAVRRDRPSSSDCVQVNGAGGQRLRLAERGCTLELRDRVKRGEEPPRRPPRAHADAELQQRHPMSGPAAVAGAGACAAASASMCDERDLRVADHPSRQRLRRPPRGSAGARFGRVRAHFSARGVGVPCGVAIRRGRSR